MHLRKNLRKQASNPGVFPAAALSPLLRRQRQSYVRVQLRGLGLNKHKDEVPSDRDRLKMFLVVKAFIANPQTSEFGLYQIIDVDLL